MDNDSAQEHAISLTSWMSWVTRNADSDLLETEEIWEQGYYADL